MGRPPEARNTTCRLRSQGRVALPVCMDNPAYAIGQAVFIRTDVPDYEEETVPFKTLDEMVKVCCEPQPNRVLEKIVVFSLAQGEPCALTLSFVSATKGQRPGNLETVS
jgi:hypothetical protein